MLNHNLETVPRLYTALRPQAGYERSLMVLKRSRQWADATGAAIKVKTGIMAGVGETLDEVIDLMRDAAAAGIQILTIGQYLQPTAKHHPVHPLRRAGRVRRTGRHRPRAGYRLGGVGPHGALQLSRPGTVRNPGRTRRPGRPKGDPTGGAGTSGPPWPTW